MSAVPLKPNPGCKMPGLQQPAGIDALIKNNVVKSAAYKATIGAISKALAPVSSTPGGAALAHKTFMAIKRKLAQTEGAKRLAQAVKDTSSQITRVKKQMDALGNVPCPCSKVPDKAAAKKS